ncbi:MAG: glycosyltransferase family 9 protein [Limisphaerales bacterium]
MVRNENILLIRLKSIGDILFLLPAVHVIRENFPGAKITFLTSSENAPLLQGFQEVDEAIALDRARFQSGNPRAVLSEAFSLFRRLRRGRFSLVVDFQGYGETAWLARLSGAPQRWGSVYGPGRRWAYTHGVTRDDRLHHVDRYLALLEQCGLRPGKILNEFVLPDEGLNAARQFFAAHDLNTAKSTLFIQPFTSSPGKNWPLDRHLAVAQLWRKRGWQILFGGGPAERTALESVHQAGFPVSAGVPLLVTGGLMKLSSFILGGDTGALHLAVALGKRVVMIRNSIAPGSPYPYQHPDWAVIPTSGRVVSSIETSAVIEACERALNERAGNVSC